MSRTVFEINNVQKVYRVKGGADVHALNGVNLTVSENEFICVVGPSGCGKTTLLNIIAGLETVDSGEVTIEGQRIIGPGPDRAVIFQQYALYPWMTVLKNVMFPLKFQRKHIVSEKKDASGKSVKVIKDVRYTKKEKEEIARKYIKMVDLEGFEDAFPSRLSGGMKQRVAIARAYVGDAEVLLMDEPFGAVDAQTRSQLQEDLLKTWAKEKKTCFFITHDVEEAVLIMSARPGRIKKIIEIDLPYPRNQATKMTPEFNAYKNQVWEQVYQEYLEVKR